jgi:restriction endonuclease S subunit
MTWSSFLYCSFTIKCEDSEKDIFHLTKEEEVYIQDEFQTNGIGWGKYNYITTTEFNNWVFRKVDKHTNEGKVITVATNAECLNFYQNEPFLTNSDIAILSIKNYYQMDVYVGLFLNTVLSINSKYHDWNYKRGIARIEKEWVMLPINDQGEPDWEFNILLF